MISPALLPGLSHELQQDSTQAENFVPPTWPPTDDFPVVIDRLGNVVSRYGDSVWDITPWLGQVGRINFRDGKIRKGSFSVSKENSALLRLVVASWLYSSGSVKTATTLVTRFEIILPLFCFCSTKGILASDLGRFPLLEPELPQLMRVSGARTIINILHDVWEKRDLLGFHILDKHGIRRLAQAFPDYEKSQTPYIPPRIWSYQVVRLRSCLEDFIAHRKKIEDCYHFCLQEYALACGSLSQACQSPPTKSRAPFSNSNRKTDFGETPGGASSKFSAIAQAHGIYDLLNRWLEGVDKAGISAFSQYLSFITAVGTAYIASFSLMRINETLSLRADCLSVEKLPETGDVIHIIRGETTKTLSDNDACWIVSPSVSLAVEAMTVISRLRMISAAANPDVPVLEDDVINPYLVVRPYEPWRAKSQSISQPIKIRPYNAHYGLYIEKYPKLFSLHDLIITHNDFETALKLTPTLDTKTYVVGKPWPLAWHQLRRTGAVNMLASGLVSDVSLQYQLKHVSRMMTRYYGRGYYNIGFTLNGEAQSEFIREMYNMVAREFSDLQSERYVSPHGLKRKNQILKLVSEKDHSQLVMAAKSGKISYRATILGGCASSRPCPYGGIDCVVQCAGGDGKPACKEALYDRDGKHKILALKEDTEIRLSSAPANSPLKDALQYQLIALENVINVIA